MWIQPDFNVAEAGALYGPGLDLMGLRMARLVILRVPRPRDALWAMEEALKCRAAGAVVAELASDDADLTATRRLSLAAREGGGLGLILHPTRPEAAAAHQHRDDALGGRVRRAASATVSAGSAPDLRAFACQKPPRPYRPVALVVGSS